MDIEKYVFSILQNILIKDLCSIITDFLPKAIDKYSLYKRYGICAQKKVVDLHSYIISEFNKKLACPSKNYKIYAITQKNRDNIYDFQILEKSELYIGCRISSKKTSHFFR